MAKDVSVPKDDDGLFDNMTTMMVMMSIMTVAIVAVVAQLMAPRIQHIGSGTLTADGKEQTLVEYTDSEPFRIEGWINVSAMQAGDQVDIRRYVQLMQGGYELADSYTIMGVPPYPLVRVIPSAAMYGVRVTLQQSVGGYRDYPWEFYISRG